MSDSRQHRFEALVDQFSNDLFRYAIWLCGNKATAEDLVQETYMRAWRSLDKLKSDGAAKSWLFTIIRRENARLYERERPETGGIDTSQVMDHNFYDTSTEAFALRNALAKLADKYREPLLLQVLGGFSCDEISGMLDLSVSAVMTRVSRARKQLRDMLSEDQHKRSEAV